MNRRTYHFGGRVQGVGFRYTVSHLAQQYDVGGYVRNLPDGRVELVVEGEDEQVNPLIDDIRRKMEGFIRDQQCQVSPATGEFGAFGIRH
jgi:acylphosphatase